jgi:hypothetical protein
MLLLIAQPTWSYPPMNAPELPLIANPASTDREDEQATLVTCAFFFVLAWAIYQALKAWPEKHRRAQLLAAYGRRRSWKKADVPRLQALGVNKSAQRRMVRLAGRSRPVVPKARSLIEEIEDKLKDIRLLIDPHAPSIRRRRALRNWPCWPQYVEALYRGEYAQIKKRGVKGPSEEAEPSVGSALGMSPATVRRICGGVRRNRVEGVNTPEMPPMTLAEFDAWFEGEESLLQLVTAMA